VYSRGRSVYNTRIISDLLPDDQPDALRTTTVEDLPDAILGLIIEFFNLNILLEISLLNENQWTDPIEKAMPRVFHLNFPLLKVDACSLWNAHGVWPKRLKRGPFNWVKRKFSLTRHFQSMMRLSSTKWPRERAADQWHIKDQWPIQVPYHHYSDRQNDNTRWYIQVCYVCECTFRCIPKHQGRIAFGEDEPVQDGDDSDDGWFDNAECECLKRFVTKEMITKSPDGYGHYVNGELAACSNDCYWILRENLELLDSQRTPSVDLQGRWQSRPPFHSSLLSIRPRTSLG
jgi:hypothetical protein